MKKTTRRTAILGLLGFGAGGYFLRDAITAPVRQATSSGGATSGGMVVGAVMGGATSADLSTYMEMFSRHTEIRRWAEIVPGGVRTVTESDAPDLAAKLQAHVTSMYAHLNQGTEVTCMSDSLPTLFRSAERYQRTLRMTPNGVAVTETSNDPHVARAIRGHALEVTGFVRRGMPAMMHEMSAGQGMMG